MIYTELESHIYNKLKYSFSIERCIIIDETMKHRKHKHFQENRFHIKLIITSSELNALSKIEAHKNIYGCISDLINEYIHALSIKLCK